MNYLHCVKSVRIRSFSGPYFPAFGLNTERYEVSLCYYSECWKMRTSKKYRHFSRSARILKNSTNRIPWNKTGKIYDTWLYSIFLNHKSQAWYIINSCSGSFKMYICYEIEWVGRCWGVWGTWKMSQNEKVKGTFALLKKEVTRKCLIPISHDSISHDSDAASSFEPSCFKLKEDNRTTLLNL